MTPPDATVSRLPHDCTCTPAATGDSVRAFLRELSAWLADRQYRLTEARDERDAAYRRGWNDAIGHVAEHAAEHAGAQP